MKKKNQMIAALFWLIFLTSSCNSNKIPEAKVKILATGKDIVVRDRDLKFYEEGDSIQLKLFGMLGSNTPWDVIKDDVEFIEEGHKITIDSSDKKTGWHFFESEYHIGVIQKKY